LIIKVICVNKANAYHYEPHEAISHLGWLDESDKKTGKYTTMEMVAFIERGGIAYTKDQSGHVAYLIVKTSNTGNKYVKTIADITETDNLLYLPECP
jgi:hypothetical protein